MTWRDTLQELQQELAEARAERLREAKEEESQREAQRQRLTQMAASLEVSRLVEDMNAVLLRGEGSIESYSSWEDNQEGDDDEDNGLLLPGTEEEEDADYVSVVLAWEEDGEREIAVDLGMGEQGLYLQVNGVDVRPEREALEQALVEAFREELEL